MSMSDSHTGVGGSGVCSGVGGGRRWWLLWCWGGLCPPTSMVGGACVLDPVVAGDTCNGRVVGGGGWVESWGWRAVILARAGSVEALRGALGGAVMGVSGVLVLSGGCGAACVRPRR